MTLALHILWLCRVSNSQALIAVLWHQTDVGAGPCSTNHRPGLGLRTNESPGGAQDVLTWPGVTPGAPMVTRAESQRRWLRTLLGNWHRKVPTLKHTHTYMEQWSFSEKWRKFLCLLYSIKCDVVWNSVFVQWICIWAMTLAWQHNICLFTDDAMYVQCLMSLSLKRRELHNNNNSLFLSRFPFVWYNSKFRIIALTIWENLLFSNRSFSTM